MEVVRLRTPGLLTVTMLAVVSGVMSAQQPAATSAVAKPNPHDTEVFSPEPKVVTRAAVVGQPPSDAAVLFDGHSLDEWVSAQDHTPTRWMVQDGLMVVNKTKGLGNIETKRKLKNYQLHAEFKIPAEIKGTGQARGNSGLFLASTGPGDDGSELQIMDSYNNKTYVNGQAGSIYSQSAPLVNPNRKPGEWQSYDVAWTAPVFAADESVKAPVYATVLFNGLLVQNHFALNGQTLYAGTLRTSPMTRLRSSCRRMEMRVCR